MSILKNVDIGKLILRLACGGLLLFHGYHKTFVDIEPIKEMVSRQDLPGLLAYGTIIGEFFAPLFVIAGFKSRIAAMIVAFNMLMSILIAHRDIAFKINDYGGWMIELNVIYMLAAIAITFLGSGKYSLSRGGGKWD
jgi:putative oxidoreductase